MRKALRAVWLAPRYLLLLLVWVYQRVVSPLLGPTCRYYPSCSSYAVTALRRHGLIAGTLLTVWRLLRCNPFTRGGVDDVPDRFWPWQGPAAEPVPLNPPLDDALRPMPPTGQPGPETCAHHGHAA